MARTETIVCILEDGTPDNGTVVATPGPVAVAYGESFTAHVLLFTPQGVQIKATSQLVLTFGARRGPLPQGAPIFQHIAQVSPIGDGGWDCQIVPADYALIPEGAGRFVFDVWLTDNTINPPPSNQLRPLSAFIVTGAAVSPSLPSTSPIPTQLVAYGLPNPAGFSGAFLQSLGASGGGASLQWAYGASSEPAAANTVYAGPVTGPAAPPSFRALVPADLPTTTPIAWAAEFEVDYRTQPAGQTVFLVGDPTATDPYYLEPYTLLTAVKNPAQGTTVPGINSDYIRLRGELHGHFNGLDSGNGIMSEEIFVSSSDFTFRNAQSGLIEGGDFYLQAGQGSDGSLPGSLRQFGGSLRLYSGAQGPNPQAGNNFCGLVIADTINNTTPGVASGLHDISIGESNANTVGIGRLTQGDAPGYTGATGTEISGRTIDLLVPAGASGGALLLTQGGVNRIAVDTGGNVAITSAASGAGITLTPGSFGATVDGAFAVVDETTGGIVRLSVTNDVTLHAQFYLHLQAGAGLMFEAPPQMPNYTTTARNALGVQLNGTEIFNTTTNKPNWYVTGTGWLNADGSPA